ncbi:MAG TPA: hypothetical protein VME41_15500 [Stellaceae bacterium]|nr:hypothetical protein [Stellaceae bacterium]
MCKRSIVAALSLLVVAGCATRHTEETGTPAHSNPIVIDQFAVSPGVITLDPTLGYSLNRGAPGVPRRERAEAVGRAAAFNLGDAIRRELQGLGYDVVSGDEAAVQSAERALIVSGAFRHIDEGRRHEGASVAVDVTIEFEDAGQPPHRLTAFTLTSQRLPREDLVPASGRRGEDVNYEASRVGAAVGRYVAQLAQTDHWPGG